MIIKHLSKKNYKYLLNLLNVFFTSNYKRTLRFRYVIKVYPNNKYSTYPTFKVFVLKNTFVEKKTFDILNFGR